MSKTKVKTSSWPLQHFLTDTKLPPKFQINTMCKGGGRGGATHPLKAARQLRPRLPQFVASFENEDGRVFDEFRKKFFFLSY